MDSDQFDPGDIAIRCPGCGQRFKVGPGLRGRMVECGSCDRRFRVEDEVMVHKRKVYPGERRDPSLDRFGRVPTRAGAAPTFARANYEPQAPSPVAVEPTSPFRLVFGAAGVVLMLMMALILGFGGQPGGMLDGSSSGKRLVPAIFTALVGSSLIIFASPHARKKAVLISLAMTAGLVSLPLLVSGAGGGPVEGIARDVPGISEPVAEEAPGEAWAAEKSEMVYDPLQKLLDRYEAAGVDPAEKTAVGLWLRGMKDFNKLQVVSYLKRGTGAGEDTWIYNRPDENYLLVLADIPPDLEEIARLCSRFGKVRRVMQEIQVIEVEVDNDSFVQGPVDKLQDPSNPSFYELNRRELDSIDMNRARDAVRRLAGVEPKVYRKDIVARLKELIEVADADLKRDISRALAVWAEDGDGSIEAVRAAAASLIESKTGVSPQLMAFLVDKRDPESIPLLDQLWAEDPTRWESPFGDMGPGIEPHVIARYGKSSLINQLSATRLLGRVGTARSLPVLRAARAEANSELQTEINRAIEEIESRG